MKATISAHEPPILLEANLGDMFIVRSVGFEECVCTLRNYRSVNDDIRVDVDPAKRRDPEMFFPVVVVACRVARGEPGYMPIGYCQHMRGAAPVTFLEQVEPLALREREERVDDDSRFWSITINRVPATPRKPYSLDDYEYPTAPRQSRGYPAGIGAHVTGPESQL